LDFVNCHFVILNARLKSHNSKLTSTDVVKTPGVSLLQEYLNDRQAYLTKYNTSKQGMIKLMNNQVCKKSFFQEVHNQIYKEFLPALIKQNKQLFNRIKKQRIKGKKDYNFEGAFLAHYLQNIENNLLQILYKHLNEKG
jgi:hypothetical protein